MAGTKISALGSLSVLADGSIVPVVDSGTNYKLAATAIRDYVLAGKVTATNFYATSNGLGTSYQIGDDAWIGDVNLANGFRVTGIEDASQGYIVFGNANNTVYIGRSGSGPITVTGNFAVTGTTTLATSLSGLLKSTSGVVSAASAGTDYVTPSGLTTTLSSYVTSTSLTSTLTSYVTSTTLSGYNYITTSSLSVGTANAASGSGAISYSAGVFKYTPPDLSTYAPLAGPTFTGAVTAGASTTVKDVRDTVYSSGTTSGGITPDCANGNIQTITLTGSITFNAFSNPVSGQSMTLLITQPSSGGPYTLTSTMKFANGAKTLSTAANAVDMLTVSYVGSTYYASLITGFA
jgi:hypothetical protein